MLFLIKLSQFIETTTPGWTACKCCTQLFSQQGFQLSTERQPTFFMMRLIRNHFLFRWTLRLDELLRTLQEAEGAISLLQNKENRHWVAYRRAGHSWLKLDSLADRPQEYPEARLFESFTKYPTYAVLLQE